MGLEKIKIDQKSKQLVELPDFKCEIFDWCSKEQKYILDLIAELPRFYTCGSTALYHIETAIHGKPSWIPNDLDLMVPNMSEKEKSELIRSAALRGFKCMLFIPDGCDVLQFSKNEKKVDVFLPRNRATLLKTVDRFDFSIIRVAVKYARGPPTLHVPYTKNPKISPSENMTLADQKVQAFLKEIEEKVFTIGIPSHGLISPKNFARIEKYNKRGYSCKAQAPHRISEMVGYNPEK